MSKKLADFFQSLATDASLLKKFNTGTGAELAKNREALMQQAGLSEDEKNVVRGHDNALADKALRAGLNMQLDGWSNSSNTSITISPVSDA